MQASELLKDHAATFETIETYVVAVSNGLDTKSMAKKFKPEFKR